jgi:hypothetical protein
VLHKIFNRNTVKVSYSCTKNIRSVIDNHNSKIIASQRIAPTSGERHCNCRARNTCPLNGNCLAKCIVYQATVDTADKSESYIGSTALEFKSRYNNHTASFRHSSKRNSTELSKYIWGLKDNNVDHTISWKIIGKAHPCTNGNSACNLCLMEKYYIIRRPAAASLNNRNSLVTACRHSNKFLLSNYNSPGIT